MQKLSSPKKGNSTEEAGYVYAKPRTLTHLQITHTHTHTQTQTQIQDDNRPKLKAKTMKTLENLVN